MLWLLLAVFFSPGPDVLHTKGRSLRVHYEVDESRSVPATGVALLARRPGEAWAEVGEAGLGQPLRFRPDGEGVWQLAAVGIGEDGSRETPGDEPEAVVVVDRTAPEIHVESAAPESGFGVVLRWRALDAHLAREPVGVRLDMAGADASWRGGRTGRVALSEPPAGERWTVTLSATDRAGNRTEVVVRYPEGPMRRHVPVDLAAAGGFRRQPEPPAGPGSYALGRSLLSRGLSAAAEEELRRVVAAAPDHARAWNDLGVALARQGRTTEAANAFDRAVASEPHLAVAERNLAIAGGRRATTPAPSGPAVDLAGGR